MSENITVLTTFKNFVILSPNRFRVVAFDAVMNYIICDFANK